MSTSIGETPRDRSGDPVDETGGTDEADSAGMGSSFAA
jgi:hypothetical protein